MAGMKISIVTPTFNSSQYIEDTLKSIHSQRGATFEHIVVDGLSKDNTVEIALKYNAQIICEKDHGQSDAINKGLRIVSGEIHAWQNADDLYSEGTLKTVADFFAMNPDVDFVYGDYQLIDQDGKWICDVYPIEWSKWLFAHGRFCPLQPTVFWRSKVTQAIGLLDTNLHYCMDVDFFSRAINAGFKFRKIPKILGQFRVHMHSKTQNPENRARVRNEYRKVLATHFNYNTLDLVLFNFFQYRSRIASVVKQRLLKRL